MKLRYKDYETGFLHVWDGSEVTCFGDAGEERFREAREPIKSVALAYLDKSGQDGSDIIVLHINGTAPAHALEVTDFEVSL
ncbi:hypothetical protein E8D34_14910 [Nocardioides sp. GY 10113]|uniref:hypothetical protein n=1 Tax=Nocardioides sp. GY 10113 TaxID=2569761 RepID=UPI0010A923A2|nr:hypothetical protein [Nocardioides sp. GY 10113]TIC83851.1 hypothetical protein E8D34_14910 [Nocardioides sp. GY 10113]